MVKRIITVSREFGSGGRSVGKALAKRLGWKYYDKELVKAVAEKTGFDPRFIEERGEFSVGKSLLSYALAGQGMPGVMNGMSASDFLWCMQREGILKLAEEGGCVIVGRCADYILREKKNLLTVFLHAPMEYRVKRVMTDQSITNPTLAEKTIKKQDKARADYYNFFTHKKWGDAGSAMLSVDTSMLDTDGIAALIADAVTMVERNK